MIGSAGLLHSRGAGSKPRKTVAREYGAPEREPARDACVCGVTEALEPPAVYRGVVSVGYGHWKSSQQGFARAIACAIASSTTAANDSR